MTHTLALMTLTVTRIQFILAGIICCVETGPPTAARRAAAGNRSFLSPRWQLVSARACALRTAGHPWHYVTLNWKGCVRTAICLGVVLTHGDSASAAVVWHRGKLYIIYSAVTTSPTYTVLYCGDRMHRLEVKRVCDDVINADLGL